MNTLFIILTVQIILGAFDNLWHHEITERLPAKRSARWEIMLHSLREFFYAFLFFALAWSTWHGAWAYVLLLLFILEIGITLADFVIEDMTRRLPAFERVLHTILAINVGVFMALFVPIALTWSANPSAIEPADYGLWSIFLSFCGVGVLLWAVRDAAAVLRWLRPPLWRRQPFIIGQKANSRTLLITGATGFIGQALCRVLLREGDHLIILTRDADKAWECFGDGVRTITDLEQIENLERIDAIINLAGAPIANWFWTKARRRVLLESRIQTTQAVVALISRLAQKPGVLINASAIGYYGIHDDQPLSETDTAGDGFQSELCSAWERTASAAEQFATRVCYLRLGLVLGRNGGVLPKLMMPLHFRSHVIFGSGDQWVSWIHLDDATRLIQFALDTDTLQGPINATSPQPLRHAEFIADLATRYRSLIGIKAPALLLRKLMGELSQLFVDGQKVMPVVASEHGFEFRFETLHDALEDLFNRKLTHTPINNSRTQIFK